MDQRDQWQHGKAATKGHDHTPAPPSAGDLIMQGFALSSGTGQGRAQSSGAPPAGDPNGLNSDEQIVLVTLVTLRTGTGARRLPTRRPRRSPRRPLLPLRQPPRRAAPAPASWAARETARATDTASPSRSASGRAG